jgi:hypothetical protein
LRDEEAPHEEAPPLRGETGPKVRVRRARRRGGRALPAEAMEQQ